ncbi:MULTISPECIES: class-II fumarase/aspartase family protein [Streptomyces]|uniref:class-II fumarase/aspartase family protein n=1 Tax=Streptomyces TaxID=1883 RepID=UPI00163BA870|nr:MULTISPECIES: adenylosuccinate lyase family protein [Streptomyces]MBC2876250.1 adenylosuccinate lyase family protein [Streptomyces sp. TYQ1024]UBI35526.1 adenylosuccinate lyase family protein [Streptomyces mobaraensis]UKW28119.1 adenylosuccinate lyase family protein [Streptomyces sp. TYQ1024]
MDTPSAPPAAAHCAHDRGHVVDSLFHGNAYGTPASRRIFCDRCRLQRWLYVEAVLAASQAETGMLPAATAEEIVRACAPGRVDLDALAPEFRRTGHSLVPLLRGVEAVCTGGRGEMVHLGATTQDIQDTAQALEMRDVLDEADREVAAMVARLADLAEEHRDSLMTGRSYGQPAVPITFGLKAAGWLDELLRHAGRLARLREEALVAQLFGGAGTMAGFGPYGGALLDVFARRLGLGVPDVCWHTARDRPAEFGTVLALLAAGLARIANEVHTLSRPEIGELAEGWEHGRVGSSTMPHKRNPERSAQVVVLARLARANAALGIEGMVQEHERDARGLRMEWVALADVSHHTLAALAALNTVLAGLRVDRERMAENARRMGEQLCSETLMLALGRAIGKQSAHALVYEASQHAQDDGGSLRAALARHDVVGRYVDAAALEEHLDPARYLGASGELTDRTVERARRWLAAAAPAPAHR